MTRIAARSSRAARALELVTSLQGRFVAALEQLAESFGTGERFERIEWLRDEGRHGGGERYAVAETAIFNRASVNVSCVHYDDEPDRRLGSATALSTIIHPRSPHAPSVHIHISWTEMRSGKSYWRLMADLNPAIEDDAETRAFDELLRSVAGSYFESGKAQGEAYFFIPALGRHRGVSHFYLEGHSSGDFAADFEFTTSFGEHVIDGYAGMLGTVLQANENVSSGDLEAQLGYHSLYLLQVLTLDRGTTSGLLIHDQNDVGILGSLPAYVDRDLLDSWVAQQPAPQDELLRAIVSTLPDASPCPVTDEVRAELAQVIRGHYQAHPEALELQASGGVIPPTVANHQ